MEAHRYIETLIGTHLALDLPQRFENQRVEVIVLTIDDPPRRRIPPPSLAGKMTYDNDLFDSAPASDWEQNP